jgi:outer membrane cobalamin receptor
VVRRPGFTAFGRLSFQATASVNIHGIYRFTGDRYDAGYDGSLGPYGALARINVDAYHLFDAGVTWRVSEALPAALRIENLFDEDYREVVGFQTRGRSTFVKVTARF